MEELADEIIMGKVKNGQLPELSVLFDRYHVKLYNFFLKLTLDKGVSQDLTQNVFYRIIKYRQTFNNEEGSFKSWVYKMARNIHFDHCRQQKKTKEVIRNLGEVHENISNVEEKEYEGDFNRLGLALLQLQPDQRELIILSRFSGLKYEEISRIHGKSIVAVRVQLHRAIKHLRKIYFNQ